MTIQIIVDGYNLIRQSERLSRLDITDIQLGRDELIRNLAAYKRIKGHRITVVFDGIHAPPDAESRDRVRGIDVRFSRRGESADLVIKQMTSRFKEEAVVVTSDRDVAEWARSKGSGVVDSRAFERKMEFAAQMAAADMEASLENPRGWIPTTRKKGPSRRLPKRDRQNLQKTRKL
jgi:hypothetical protein